MDNMPILNLCRICLIEAHRSKGMQPLFDDTNNQCVKIVQMIEECGGIVLKPLDNYPRMICVQCLDALNASYQFRSMCQSSENAIVEAIVKMKPRLHSKVVSSCLIKPPHTVVTGGEGLPHAIHHMRIINPDLDVDREDPNTNGDEIYLDLRPEFIEENDVQYDELANVKSEFEREQDYVAMEEIQTESPLSEHQPEQIDYEHEDAGDIDENNVADESTDRLVATISIDNDADGISDLAHQLEQDNSHIEDDGAQMQVNLEQIEISEFSTILIPQKKSNKNDKETIIEDDTNTNTLEDGRRLASKFKGKKVSCTKASNVSRKGRPPKSEDTKKHVQQLSITNLNNKRKRKTETEPEANICEICGNIYSKRSILNMHMRRHRAEKPFECDICGKLFTCPSEISRHIRIHTGEKPYVCRFCGRTFSDRSTNIKHERIHTNERPFKCQTCGKSFTYSNVLKNHILTHTGEKPFSCIPCNKTFSRKHQLDQHLATLTHRQLAKKMSTGGTKMSDEIITGTSKAVLDSADLLSSSAGSQEKSTCIK